MCHRKLKLKLNIKITKNAIFNIPQTVKVIHNMKYCETFIVKYFTPGNTDDTGYHA